MKAGITKGAVVKLKFGKDIGRANYRGRVIGVFSIGTAGHNAEVIWFGDAKNEMGARGTFPLNELLPA